MRKLAAAPGRPEAPEAAGGMPASSLQARSLPVRSLPARQPRIAVLPTRRVAPRRTSAAQWRLGRGPAAGVNTAGGSIRFSREVAESMSSLQRARNKGGPEEMLVRLRVIKT